MPDQHSTLRERRRAQTRHTIQTHAIRLFSERGYDATTMNDVADAAGVSPMTVYRHFATKEDLVLVDQYGELIADRIAASPADRPLVRRIATALIDAATTLTGGDATPDRQPNGGVPTNRQSADDASGLPRGADVASDRPSGGDVASYRPSGGGVAVERQFLLARLRLMITTPALRARHLDNQYALQQAIVGALEGDAADPDAAFEAQAAASACLAALHTAMVRWAEDDGRTDLPHLITKALAAVFGDDVTAPTR